MKGSNQEPDPMRPLKPATRSDWTTGCIVVCLAYLVQAIVWAAIGYGIAWAVYR